MMHEQCPLCGDDGPQTVAKIEKAALVRALERCNGNQTAVAAMLGISRVTVFNMLRRNSLTVEDVLRSGA